jgi:hypothetical protein
MFEFWVPAISASFDKGGENPANCVNWGDWGNDLA